MYLNINLLNFIGQSLATMNLNYVCYSYVCGMIILYALQWLLGSIVCWNIQQKLPDSRTL